MRSLMTTLGIIIICATAHSTVWYVPDDHPSIQTALDAAAAGDTIVVRSGSYVENIDFKGKAVTLTSELGAAVTVIDGNLAGSVVTCRTSEGTDTVLDGFTVTNGFEGMRNESVSPTVIHCSFTLNQGPGMHNQDSSPTVTDCVFSENNDYEGAGMLNTGGSPTISNCVFTGNSAYVMVEGRGGGMYNAGCSPLVMDCTFNGNEAGDFGGGMYNNYASPTVDHCTFIGNSGSEAGGGMYNNGGTPTVINCTFMENQAGAGGGMYNSHSSSLTANCSFSENSGGNGGGMYNVGGNPTVTNCSFTLNQAGSFGGGIFGGDGETANCILWLNSPDQVHGTAMVMHSCIEGGYPGAGNIDANPLFEDPFTHDFHLTPLSPCIDAGDNGATGLQGEDFEGDLRSFDGNSDGIAQVDMGCDELLGLNVPTVYGTIQSAIQASSSGDRILVGAGKYFENIDFLGKAVHVAGMGGSGATIIDGNQVGSVAAFASVEGPDSILEGFTLTNGMAQYGGGVFCQDASPTVRKNIITENTASAGAGGGVCCLGASNPLIADNDVHDNQAASGGGIACMGSSPRIVSNILYGNCADSGGGISVASCATPVVTNNAVYQNTALSSGGGIYCGDEALSITNTIVWENAAPSDPQIMGPHAVVTYCDVQGGWPGEGNLDDDPLFIDPGAGDFHLSPDSPCMNMGDNDAPELPDWDFDGDPRIRYFFVDMGPDEVYGGGQIIRVPLDVPAIQSAIGAAANGDLVVVDPGTYVEGVDFLGKAITLKSSSGAGSTIIEGSVFFTKYEDQGSVLQGFTITKSYYGISCTYSSPTIRDNIITNNAIGIHCKHSAPTVKNNIISDNKHYSKGTGMYNEESSPTVEHCIFSGNGSTDGGGGGMHNYYYSNPMVVHCTFTGNESSSGGGMCNRFICNPTVSHCSFVDNNSEYGGGGMRNDCSDPVVSNCTFSENTANSGGGMLNEQGSDPVVTGCLFIDNVGAYGGGGMHNYWGSHPKVSNCIFSGNSATHYTSGSGGGMICTSSDATITNCTFYGNTAAGIEKGGGGLYCGYDSHPIITNTIFWSNHASQGPEIWIGVDNAPSTVSISYSDVEGGSASIHVEPSCILHWGPVMIDADPLFLDPAKDDFRLFYSSPCIEMGDNDAPLIPTLDFEGDPRIFHWNGKGHLLGLSPSGAIVDMGADEYCLLKRKQINLK